MTRRGKKRNPPTPAQRRRMMIIGALLVAFACFTILYETLAWEHGNLLAAAVVIALLTLVFVVPIVGSIRQARRSRTSPS